MVFVMALVEWRKVISSGVWLEYNIIHLGPKLKSLAVDLNESSAILSTCNLTRNDFAWPDTPTRPYYYKTTTSSNGLFSHSSKVLK